MDEEQQTKRDLKRLEQYYNNEQKKMERIARHQEKLFKKSL